MQKYSSCGLAFILLFLLACKEPKPNSNGQFINHNLLDSIYSVCPEIKKKPLTIYCMDADCPSCISKAKTLETQLQNQTLDKKLVLLAITQNKNIMEYNFKLTGISSCILIIQPHQLSKIIQLHSVTSIDPTGKIQNQISHY
jgi:hypothetical protein